MNEAAMVPAALLLSAGLFSLGLLGVLVRRNVITRSPRWLVTRVSTATVPRSPCVDSRIASTVDSE